MSPTRAAALAIAVLMAGTTRAAAQGGTLTPDQQLARDVFEQLIEINTTASAGSTTLAAEAMAARLLAAGFPAADVLVVGPDGSRNFNLVARLRGTGKRPPILFLAHLDVVEARREDWSFDPFTLLEQDGYFYGRGASDVKDGAAILVAAFIRLKQQGFTPDRDLILALTANEEGGADYNGVDWLLEKRRDLIAADYVINMDAGDPQSEDGRRVVRPVQASEKVYVTFGLEVKNPGGHSSMPVRDNAIYRLAAALTRLGSYDFPVRLNEVTRAYFARLAALNTGQLAKDMEAVARDAPDSAAAARLSAASPLYNANLRTTCVATMLQGGHAENALPQSARATVNCRMLPDDTQDAVERTLRRVVADTAVAITVLWPAVPSGASPLRPDIMSAIDRTTFRLWGDIPVIPIMETGATDGLKFRNAGVPVYGVAGVFLDINDNRAHGQDERIRVQAYYDGAEYIYELIKELST